MCSRPALKNQKKFCFVGTHEVKISCRGPLGYTLYVFCYLENEYAIFQTALMDVDMLTSILSTLQHQCHWLSQCLCKHLTICRIIQNLGKTSTCNVAASYMYQVYLATEIPDITQNYINSQVFTCRNWVSAILI